MTGIECDKCGYVTQSEDDHRVNEKGEYLCLDCYAGCTDEMSLEDFDDLILTQGKHRVTWEYIGEGWSGDYDPNDPEDTPLLRFSCDEFGAVDPDNDASPWEWYQMDDASYCTRLPVTTPTRHLARAAAIILEAIRDVNYKKELERLSWFCPEDFTATAS